LRLWQFAYRRQHFTGENIRLNLLRAVEGQFLRGLQGYRFGGFAGRVVR
jgi:hypothetical protein